MNTIIKTVSKIRVMIDIESLGLTAGSVITEIGAVACDQDFQEIAAFEDHLDVDRQVDLGLEICEKVHKWRNDNGLPYRMFDTHEPLAVLSALNSWLRSLAYENELDVEKFEFWCQGTDFDRPLLDALYDSMGSTPPWKFYQWNDSRSVCKFVGVKRQGGVIHQALEDARQQARAMQEAIQKVRNVSVGPVAASA